MRRLYLDEGPRERRGVVTLDGLPERLLIEREGQARGPRLGARYAARIDEIAPALKLAFLDLGGGERAVTGLAKGLIRGALTEVEISAEERHGKAAVARPHGQADGAARLLQPPPALEHWLELLAPDAEIVTGPAAREAADEAEDAALQVVHQLPGGLTLSIEPTTALTAVDIDWAGQGSAAKANLAGLAHAARLLRLKALGGTIVIDLVGFAGPEVAEAARRLFEPDRPGLSVLAPSRLGLLQLAKPHRGQPLGELLCAPDGRLSARSVAQRLARAVEREARADPGSRLTAACSAEVAAELPPLGPRVSVSPQLGWDRLKTDIITA
jgi:Ribonuclease G/E